MEVAQLLQAYCRLAEPELATGGRPKFFEPGEYGLPEDTADKAKEWAEREGEKARIMETLTNFNRDPIGTLEIREPDRYSLDRVLGIRIPA